MGRQVGRNAGPAIGFGLVAFRGGHLVSNRSRVEYEIFLPLTPLLVVESTFMIETDNKGPWDRRRYLEIY